MMTKQEEYYFNIGYLTSMITLLFVGLIVCILLI